MATELAKAYVQIIPSAKGIKGMLQKELGGEAAAAGESAGKSFGDSLRSGLADIGKVAAAALGAATAAVGAFASESVKTGMVFDSSMSQVAATMGKSMDELNDMIGTVELSMGPFEGTLRDFAQKMGAETAFSATQAADALNYMALAGYDVQQSMQALPNVLNLAAAGGIDLAAASDMVTDAQSALGLTMEESAFLVDQMAMASSKSNTSVAQLGEAILTIGGTAKNLAGGTTELSTALGILADNGVKGAEGGTALRNIILSLSAPTESAAKEMRKLGLNVFDAKGKMRPLEDVFTDLNGILSDMTQGEQTQVLSELFNKVDLKSVNALLATDTERWEELSAAIDNATGAAEQMANTQLDNLTGDVTLFKSAMEGVQIALSDKLTPSLREGTQFLTDLAGKAQEFIENGGIEKMIDQFTRFSPLIAAATAAFLAYKGATAISGIMEALTKATESQTIAQAALNAIINANPFVLVATLIAAVGAALVTLYMTNESFRNKVNAAWNSVKSTISDAVSAIAAFFTSTVPDGIQNLLSAFVKMKNSITSTIGNIKTSIVNGISSAVDWIKSLPGQALSWGSDMISGFGDGIMSKAHALLNSVKNVANNIRSFLHFSRPDTGPLRDYETWMPDFMQGLAKGIDSNAWRVQKAVKSLTQDMDLEPSPSVQMPSLHAAAVADAGAPMGGGTVTNLYQTINTHDSLSESELTREAEDMLERGRWKNP